MMIDSQTIEITLEDKYTEKVEVPLHQSPESPGLSTGGEVTEFDLGLPAALCDERLIDEIHSIPDKMGFKIGEVADLLGVKQYVLRYWESEFEVLKPKKAANNQRYYTRKDVENVMIIRKLLHRDRFSIEGARSALKEVKVIVRKEKDWKTVNTRIDLIQDRVDELIMGIHKLKVLFQN